ncbi:replicase protein [Potexvirus ecsalstroemeriae]|uniref:RNA replication protein n=1 Tax=Potexvirus ecsalstroemeriae TaxID=316983 RepID=Q3V6G7_9VIRU|nr:replicase protein [Alstroemeria virus X]BAE44211.1 replicase protein [Alstroemeria virus X]
MSKIRNVLDKIRDPSVQTAICENAYAQMRPVLKEALVNCPYALTDLEADALENMGISVNPYATQTHTHAACKAIENQMLQIVGHHLPKSKVTFLFLKRSKLRYMRRAAALNDHFMNKNVEPKDFFRYDSETVCANLSAVSTSIAYISDTLHFMTFEELANLFETSPKLDTLLATVVLPVEALHKRTSLHPALYSINYNKDGFEYIPGNHGGGAYFHPYDTLQWLKVRTLLCNSKHKGFPPFHLTFQMVESLGANHLFIIRRGKFETPLYRTFCRDTYVTFPKIFHPSTANANKPIQKQKAMQLWLYCKSVKAVTERDIYAKIRQVLRTEELELYEPAEVAHIVNYFYFIANLHSITCYEDLLSGSLLKRMTVPIRTAITKFVEVFRGKNDFVKLLDALKWDNFTYSIKPEDMTTKMDSHQVNHLVEEYGIPIKEAEATIAQLHREPELLNDADLDSPPMVDFLGRTTYEPFNYPRTTTPTDPKPAATTADDSASCSKPPNSAAGTSPSPNHTQPEKLKPDAQPTQDSATIPVHVSGWEREPFDYVFHTSQSQQLRGRKAAFLSTRQDIDYGHDKIRYDTNPWNEILTDFLRTVGFQANAVLIQVYEANAGIPWHRDDEKCYEKDAILTLNFGTATFEFSNGTKLHLTDGCHFIMSGEWLDLKHRVTNCSADRMSLTFRVHKQDMFGHPIPKTTLVPEQQPEVDAGVDNHNLPKETPAQEPSEASTESGPNTTKPAPFVSQRQNTRSPEEKPTVTAVPWEAWKPLLNNHGFKADEQQLNPEGFLILPILDVHKVPHSKFPDTVPAKLQDTLTQMKRFPVDITIQHQRAAAYASDIKNNRTGKLLSSMDNKWKASFAYKMQHEDITLTGTVIHGCGGSGKSHAIQQFIRTIPNDNNTITVVTPTVELRNDWSTKLPLSPPEMFKTFEKAITQPCNPVVVFDDYTKMPPGYIEAVCMHHRQIEFVILTGDSKQSVYHEANTEAYISSMIEAVEVFEPFCEFYLNATHRNVKDLANKLGVYSERQGSLKITMASHHLKQSRIPLLVPSTMKRNAMLDIGHRCMTYAGCQGLTAPKVQILLDQHTQHCSERVLYTALSRAVDSIHFINTGPNSTDYWQKLDSTPYLKAFIDTHRDEKTEMYNSQPADDSPTPVPAPKTHFPPAPSTLLENMVETLPDKEAREIYNKSLGYSNAIQTQDPVVQLFQHQQAKDETLYWATIEARLSISTPEANLREFNLKKDVGDVLFANYAQIMHLPSEPVPFDDRMWEISETEVRNTYLSKPIGNLVNAATRQSPDFNPNKIALFLKSQWVKKPEKLGALKVKPGQTVASFMQETVMLYGTMARYLRKQRQRFQPQNIFINCETTPDHLNEFIKSQWSFTQPAHTNDFTAFDQTQDGAMLQFEVLKAKFFNVPPEIIEGYIYIKLNAEIFLGTLGIMRLSGEGPTFDANTECSIAYNATRFFVDDSVAQVYAGDDMALDRVVQEKPSFKRLEHQLKLTSKPQYPSQTKGDYAEFCGWIFTPSGIMKHSLKMQASIQLQKKINNIAQSARSYALDLKYAYDMGDALQDHLTEAECELHAQSVRDMHLLHQHDVLVNGASSPPHPTQTTSAADIPTGSAKTKKRNLSKRKAKVAKIDSSGDFNFRCPSSPPRQ